MTVRMFTVSFRWHSITYDQRAVALAKSQGDGKAEGANTESGLTRGTQNG